jgi:hypothetical protein
VNCTEAPNSVCGPSRVTGACSAKLEGKCCLYSNTDHMGGETQTTVTCVNGMWQ